MGSVIVVGAGLSGLTCAWRLVRAGHEVEVLERAHEPGGRMRSYERDGFVLDAGTPVVFEGDTNLRCIAASLHLTSLFHTLGNDESAICRDFVLHADGVRSPFSLLAGGLLSTPAKFSLLRVAADLLLLGADFGPWRSSRAQALDAESLGSALRRSGAAGEELLDALLAPVLAERLGVPGEASRGIALAQLRDLLRRGRRLSLEGGSGALPRALANSVPVRYDCEVISVETATDGARVRYLAGEREGSAIADAVVMALPGCDAVGLCAKLTPSERGFFAKLRYAPEITVHLLFESAPRAPAGYRLAFPGSENLGLRAVRAEHHKLGAAPPGSGLLAVEVASNRVDGMWKAAEGELVEWVQNGLARSSIGLLTPMRSFIERRARATPLFPPGRLVDLLRFDNRVDRSPRLAFAGDYLVGPSAEAAITSGMRAATEIVRALQY